jgi:hypothetical protein
MFFDWSGTSLLKSRSLSSLRNKKRIAKDLNKAIYIDNNTNRSPAPAPAPASSIENYKKIKKNKKVDKNLSQTDYSNNDVIINNPISKMPRLYNISDFELNSTSHNLNDISSESQEEEEEIEEEEEDIEEDEEKEKEEEEEKFLSSTSSSFKSNRTKIKLSSPSSHLLSNINYNRKESMIANRINFNIPKLTMNKSKIKTLKKYHTTIDQDSIQLSSFKKINKSYLNQPKNSIVQSSPVSCSIHFFFVFLYLSH